MKRWQFALRHTTRLPVDTGWETCTTVQAMRYLSFLQSVHRQLAPERYLEIGVRSGVSLSLAQCRAVGIDPAFSITAELDGDVALFRMSSDEYFARSDPLAATGGLPFDLSF